MDCQIVTERSVSPFQDRRYYTVTFATRTLYLVAFINRNVTETFFYAAFVTHMKKPVG